MVLLTRRQKVHLIIHNASVVAGGIGAGWLGELILLSDAVPLCLLQTAMVAALGVAFLLRPHKALILGLVTAFLSTILGRGVSGWMFQRLPEHEAVINIAVAVGLTEALGWLMYKVFRAMRKRPSESILSTALSATQRGPLRVLFLSLPTLLSLLSSLIVLDVRHLVDVRLVAPGGAAPILIEHPLLSRSEGTLEISGLARGLPDRVLLPVRNDELAAELERKVLLLSPPPRMRVLCLVPEGTQHHGLYRIESDWTIEVRRVSDYWQKVRGRLYLLLFGLLGTAALFWLGQHRTRAITE